MGAQAPVIAVAIEPKTKADHERLTQGLQKLTAEDPTVRVQTDPKTGQTTIAGMGELQLDVIVERLKAAAVPPPEPDRRTRATGRNPLLSPTQSDDG